MTTTSTDQLSAVYGREARSVILVKLLIALVSGRIAEVTQKIFSCDLNSSSYENFPNRDAHSSDVDVDDSTAGQLAAAPLRTNPLGRC